MFEHMNEILLLGCVGFGYHVVQEIVRVALPQFRHEEVLGLVVPRSDIRNGVRT